LNARKTARWVVLLGVLVFTAFQAVAAIRDYRKCQASVMVGDRSGADLYGLNIDVDGAETLVAWGVRSRFDLPASTKSAVLNHEVSVGMDDLARAAGIARERISSDADT
jgi:hypothetical protein